MTNLNSDVHSPGSNGSDNQLLPERLAEPERVEKHKRDNSIPTEEPVPNDWNVERDVVAFEYVHGPSSKLPEGMSRRHFMGIRIRGAYRDVNEVLSRAVCAVYGWTDQVHKLAVRDLSFASRINLLREYASKCQDPEFRPELEVDIERYEAAEQLRAGVMERFVRDPESVWLSDLVVLGDWLVGTWNLSELNGHPEYQSIDDDPTWTCSVFPDLNEEV